MIIRHLEAGPLAVNCYIIGDETTKDAIVVDPGGDVPLILALLKEEGLTCRIIFNTHTHFDHIGGNAELKKKTGAELVTHPLEAKHLGNASAGAMLFGMRVPNSPGADRTVVEGDTLTVGSLTADLVELPGHSPAGLALLYPGHAFVGDALFAGSIGRTDFPGGSFTALTGSIRDKLFVLPDDTLVYPGHGPKTTIGREKRSNPFF
jgi:glyoxylase-like metal-dependent hydrolase (beta-lactamase superfamily II)